MKKKHFERVMLAHLDAAYSLARWLMGDDQEAQDVVQSAYTRAFESADTYENRNSAAWILTIVRNQAYNALTRRKRAANLVSFEEFAHSHCDSRNAPSTLTALTEPEDLARQKANEALLHDVIDRLPPEFREVLLLREMEGYSYQEIADITRVPKGTVMSRLHRARKHLLEQLERCMQREGTHGM